MVDDVTFGHVSTTWTTAGAVAAFAGAIAAFVEGKTVFARAVAGIFG